MNGNDAELLPEVAEPHPVDPRLVRAIAVLGAHHVLENFKTDEVPFLTRYFRDKRTAKPKTRSVNQ